jgi:hypothetical protein
MIAIHENIAVYAGRMTLTAAGLYGDGFVDKRLNPDNCTLIDIQTPTPWKGRGYVWDGSTLTMTPQFAVESLEEAKAAKKNEIEFDRDAELEIDSASVVVNGHPFDANPMSIKQLNDALTTFIALGGVPSGFEWRDAENVNHPADLTLLASIAAARAEQVNNIWKRSWERKAALEIATTLAEVDGV